MIKCGNYSFKRNLTYFGFFSAGVFDFIFFADFWGTGFYCRSTEVYAQEKKQEGQAEKPSGIKKICPHIKISLQIYALNY
jgi:hypothetical protein